MVDCVPLAWSNSAAACLTSGCNAEEPSAVIFWPARPAILVAAPTLVVGGASSAALTLHASSEALARPLPLLGGGVQAATTRLDTTTAPSAACIPSERIAERIADKRSCMSRSLRA